MMMSMTMMMPITDMTMPTMMSITAMRMMTMMIRATKKVMGALYSFGLLMYHSMSGNQAAVFRPNL